MRRVVFLLVWTAATAVPAVHAQESDIPLQTPHYSLDRGTLRRGAELFADHCLSCHDMKYLRYSRIAHDLGLTKAQVKRLLMTPDKAAYNKTMINTLNPHDAAKWFGTAPPDLTLEARYRGTDWIYTYLKSFYLDPARPLGWNNHVFPQVAMPNVLALLGGVRDARGALVEKGSLNERQYDQLVTDLTAWLQYASDPSKIQRQALGPWVIGFLIIFAVLAYLLKRAYWRAVH